MHAADRSATRDAVHSAPFPDGDARVRNAVAVFSSRETPDTLLATVRAAIVAAGPQGRVDVLVNGNRALAHAIGERVSDPAACPEPGRTAVRVWFIACADKAHTWNVYVAEIWAPGDIAFFVDGYARVRADAFVSLRACLGADAKCLGATGVPTRGRSAARLTASMRSRGGIHGNCYAIKGEVMARLKARRIRLPRGLYRTDSTIGAVLSFDLDPAANSWDPGRIAVQEDATWDIDAGRWWKPADLRAQIKRALRQGQGVLENQAVRDHLAIRRQPPETLPETAAELVFDWAARRPEAARRAARFSYSVRRALRELARPKDWSAKDIPPQCLVATDA